LKDYYRRSTCRLCGGADLRMVLSLTATPLANAFVAKDQLSVSQDRYPLDVRMCGECGHVQLLDVVDPKVLYEHYVYVSGTSPVFVRHFESYARYVNESFRPRREGLVVEIGSNDGTLLRFFKQQGHRVLGVEPAREISEATRQAGIPTLTEFFSPELAERILREHGAASVIAANNVMAHIDDLSAVVRGIARLLAPDGVFIFEVSYLVDVLQKTLFDTIYHEHLDYHSVEPLIPFFAAHGLELIEAVRVDTHGGSLRGVVQRKGAGRPRGESVAAALQAEQALGLRREETYRAFAAHIDRLGRELTELLDRASTEGKRVAGFGAPAKATTLMYQLGIKPESFEFIVDDSPLKQGLFTPGMHIPVVSSEALYERKPDIVVVLAWNFAASIIEKHRKFREMGGRFIIPVPSVQLL
jgi:SAM-dependent methyltransferase